MIPIEAQINLYIRQNRDFGAGVLWAETLLLAIDDLRKPITSRQGYYDCHSAVYFFSTNNVMLKFACHAIGANPTWVLNSLASDIQIAKKRLEEVGPKLLQSSPPKTTIPDKKRKHYAFCYPAEVPNTIKNASVQPPKKDKRVLVYHLHDGRPCATVCTRPTFKRPPTKTHFVAPDGEKWAFVSIRGNVIYADKTLGWSDNLWEVK